MFNRVRLYVNYVDQNCLSLFSMENQWIVSYFFFIYRMPRAFGLGRSRLRG